MDDVFGVSRRIPLTYVARPYVDEEFAKALKRHKHIVVFGGSKQGKTSLRKNCLPEAESIVVQCANASSREKLYELVLKEAGARVEVANSLTLTGAHKFGVEFGGEAKVPMLMKGSGKGAAERSRSRASQKSFKSFEIDLSDVNDIVRVLDEVGFRRRIVFEDFHYLSEEVQKEIAIDLKAFHEKSELTVVIIGVWLESNRLEMFNGDLVGRIVSINADHWERTDLEKVINEGQPLLNVLFNETAKTMIVEQCQNNVGLLQEICNHLCQSAGVIETSTALRTVGSSGEVLEVVESIAAQQAGRYSNFLREFSHGFQTTELDMYRWITFAVVTASDRELRAGLKFPMIHRAIESAHPKADGELHRNNVLQALTNVRRLQHKKQVRPIILDYDTSGNVLRVVDIGFILYLNSKPKPEVLDLIECGNTISRPAIERRTRRRRAMD